MEVIFKRPKQFIDRLRSYEIFINCVSVGKINAGGELKANIESEAILVEARIDWCSSEKYEFKSVKEGQIFEVINPSSYKSWIPFFSLYAISFGKNKYLAINKIE